MRGRNRPKGWLVVEPGDGTRTPYEVEHPRPMVTESEVRQIKGDLGVALREALSAVSKDWRRSERRSRANEAAVLLALAGDRLSALQRAIRLSRVEIPGPPQWDVRPMTPEERSERDRAGRIEWALDGE